MPQPTISTTPYPLIDSDPHFTRVVRYFRLSDYAVWAAGTAGFPAVLAAWGTPLSICARNSFSLTVSHPESIDKTKTSMRTAYRLGGVLGFVGGFLLAYQRSTSVYSPVPLKMWLNYLLCQNVSGVGPKTKEKKNVTLRSSVSEPGKASPFTVIPTNPWMYKASRIEIPPGPR
jgi:hypothetical protein